MTLDIRGSRKNTKLSSNKYVVIDELISNSIDSFLIRNHNEGISRPLEITIAIDLFHPDLFPEVLDVTISCTDNGCGLGPEQIDAFLTKDTSYKDDLAIAGIGKCKGAGRIQYFLSFEEVGVTSTYREGDQVLRRDLPLLGGRKKIDLGDFTIAQGMEKDIGTTISLRGLRDQARDRLNRSESLGDAFSAANIRRHMLMAFLQRLVSLKTELGAFKIIFKTTDPQGASEKVSLEPSDLPPVTDSRSILIEERSPQSGVYLGTSKTFTLTHYKLSDEHFDLPRNAISFCAKSSPAMDITRRYLRTQAEQNGAVRGFHHIVLIEGEVLDRRVNEQRDGFDGIPEEIPASDMFVDETVSFEAIYEAIDPVIQAMVTPSGWSKDVIIQDVEEKFGVLSTMISDTETRVNYGDTARSVAERVLKKYQDRVIAETAEIFDLKQEIAKAEPYSADYRAKINELSWRYTSSLKTFDMANLSQLVVRRAAIVEILALACGKKLEVQQIEDGDKKRMDESIIHSIFFPMRKDSTEAGDHDIWLLSEEYQYYDYIASDKMLSQISWDENSMLFETDVDDSLADILARTARENNGKRPDIAIFDKEGSAIIIEFKSPGVSLDDHIGDLSEYATLLSAKSNGKLKKFYGYLIGDTINRTRISGWTRFPQGQGYFRSTPLEDPETNRGIGELYAEIMFFDDVVDRARKRIAAYKDRLKVDLSEA